MWPWFGNHYWNLIGYKWLLKGRQLPNSQNLWATHGHLTEDSDFPNSQNLSVGKEGLLMVPTMRPSLVGFWQTHSVQANWDGFIMPRGQLSRVFFPIFQLLRSFCLLFLGALWALEGVSCLHLLYSQCLEEKQAPVFTALHCKEKLLWLRSRVAFVCGYKHK